MGLAYNSEQVHGLDAIIYGVRERSSTPYDIIHDALGVCIYEEKQAGLDRQDYLDALQEEHDIALARSTFYQQ